MDVSFNEKKVDYVVVDALLQRPFQQQMIFEILSTLYNINGIPNNKYQSDTYHKEDINALGKHTILIAEDNKINQKVMSGLLSGTQLELEFADDGQEAVDKLTKNPTLYALVFMDIDMPNLDGYMATQIIQKNSKFKDVHIIGPSGYATQEDIQKAQNVGM